MLVEFCLFPPKPFCNESGLRAIRGPAFFNKLVIPVPNIGTGAATPKHLLFSNKLCQLFIGKVLMQRDVQHHENMFVRKEKKREAQQDVRSVRMMTLGGGEMRR